MLVEAMIKFGKGTVACNPTPLGDAIAFVCVKQGTFAVGQQVGGIVDAEAVLTLPVSKDEAIDVAKRILAGYEDVELGEVTLDFHDAEQSSRVIVAEAFLRAYAYSLRAEREAEAYHD